MKISFRRISAILVAPACAFSSPTGLAEQIDGSTAARQWEEIVVVGSHLPRPAREVGSTVSVLDATDISNRKLNQAAELLRQVPGLAVNRGGQEGAVTQVRIRGAEGNHTLVLIDGIEANDPFLGEFNFADLLSWDIGRIEVLRGPQSALYGSEAIGGVINVTSRAPQAGVNVHAELQGGTFGTTQLGASVSAANDRVSALLSAVNYQTDGISASAQPGENERDGYDNTTVHGKLEVAVTPALDLRLVVRHADSEVENDGQSGGLVVDTDARTDSEQLFALVELNGRLLGDRWLHRLAYSRTDSESDNLSADALTSGSRGERDKIEYETTLRFGDDVWAQALTASIEHEDLVFDFDSPSFPAATQRQTDEQTSYIGEYALTYRETTTLTLSARHDANDRFDDATTFRFTASRLLTDRGTRLHASYGEGITNPTFFELFGFIPEAFIGNAELAPEESTSWDVGVEQSLFGGRALVDVTWFEATLEEEIVTVFTPSFESLPINQAGESRRQGVEVSGTARLTAGWSLDGSYTYLDAEDPDGQAEVRRPRHSGSANANYAFLDGRGNANVGLAFNGEQEDLEFIPATPETRVTLDDFVLLNAAISFAVSDRVQLFVRGENLLDEDYTQVFGFDSPGIAGYLGMRAQL